MAWSIADMVGAEDCPQRWLAGGDAVPQDAASEYGPGCGCAVDLGAFTRLRPRLQNGLFLLLNFGSLSLGHLLLLLLSLKLLTLNEAWGFVKNELRISHSLPHS